MKIQIYKTPSDFAYHVKKIEENTYDLAQYRGM